MTTPRVVAIFGVLAVIVLGTTGTIVVAAKKRAVEMQQAQAESEAYRAKTSAQQQTGFSSPELQSPFSQFTDPVSGVQNSLSKSLYSEGRLSSTTIPELPNPMQSLQDPAALPGMAK